MLKAMVCPQCAEPCDPPGADACCASCGAPLAAAGRTDRWPAMTPPGVAPTAESAPSDATPIASDPARDAVETTIGFGPRGRGVASRSLSALGLQTSMSEAPIADAVKRLRAQMREQPHGLKNIVDLVVLVTLADGQIDEIELVALHETIGLVVGDVQTVLVRHLIHTCIVGIREQGLDATAASVRDALVGANALEDGLVVAFAAAFLSGGLSIPERGAIQALWEGTAVRHERVIELRETVRAAIDAAESKGSTHDRG